MENRKINRTHFLVMPGKILNISRKVALVFIGIFAAFLVFSVARDRQLGKVLITAKYGNVEMVSKDIIKCSLESGQSDDCVLYNLKGNKIE